MEDLIDLIIKFEKKEIKLNTERNNLLIKIINDICSKENIKISDFIFFHEGEQLIIDDKLKIGDIYKDNEDNNIIKITAVSIIKDKEQKNEKDIGKIINKNIICPKCKRYIMIHFDDYKINLSKCDKDHMFRNILLNNFYSTQQYDSKLLLSQQKENNLKIDISQECAPTPISSFKSSSKEINNDVIDNINYYSTQCIKHNVKYSSYCLDCKKNLCSECELNHNINRDSKFIHKIIHFYEILSNNDEYINKLKNEMEKFRLKLALLKIEINKITNILNNVMSNYEIYYKIYNDMVSNYNIETRNYHVLKNITNIKLDEVFQDIDRINEEGHFFIKFEKIYEIYNKMNCKNETIIRYLPQNTKNVRLFGSKFVSNNKNKCKILFNRQIQELSDFYKIDNDLRKYINSKNGILEIKLKMNKNENLTDMSHMFKDCSSLLFLPDISELNTFNVQDMSYLFYGCTLLENIPNISKWNTSNVTNMSYMFFNCASLVKLPDISNWNISNCLDLSHLFSNCVSLVSLPDISNWKVNNVTNISYLFYYCKSLKSLPNISKWNIKNVNNISYLFCCCTSLTHIPDISIWDTRKVKEMSYLFYECKSLTSIPDISKWNTSNIIDMGFMFDGLNPKIEIPKINPNECSII